jgi:aldose sugar dehydrogenase
MSRKRLQENTMPKRTIRIETALAALFLGTVSGMSAALAAENVETSSGLLQITPVAEGLEEPWGIAFLPEGGFLVTERDGQLKHFAAPLTEPTLVTGLPEILVDGQGGLLDVLVPQDFATSREVWLTYSKAQDGGSGTAIGKGTLAADGTTLDGFSELFQMPAGSSGGRHFGARMVEAPDGTIYLTLGDRGTGPTGQQAQDPMLGEGKIIHLNRDGTPATRQEGALPGLFSLGHRNPQGAALDLDGRLLVVEHGAQGGDELNAPEVGRNYGWPVISYGVNYNDDPIGVGTEQAGMEQPLHYWDPSIAPSGLLVYSGTLIPDWRGDILFGSLNSDFLGRLDPDTPADTGYAEERIATAETGRVRDVVEAPDGSIWFLSVSNGAAYRLAP